jgi:diadenosine tetraphosphate (Ap4A) HIT family hydrolase
MECEFCIRNDRIDLPADIKLAKRVLYETSHFIVFPTLGPLADGHLLISPKEHYISVGEVPSQLYPELEEITAEVLLKLSDTYGCSILFEHGPASPAKKAGSCIDHAHLHAIPLANDILEDIAREYPYSPAKSFHDLKARFEAGIPYLFYQNRTEERFVFDIPDKIPCQYLRRIVAARIPGMEDLWDWELYPDFDKVMATLKKLNGI